MNSLATIEYQPEPKIVESYPELSINEAQLVTLWRNIQSPSVRVNVMIHNGIPMYVEIHDDNAWYFVTSQPQSLTPDEITILKLIRQRVYGELMVEIVNGVPYIMPDGYTRIRLGYQTVLNEKKLDKSKK